MRKSSSGCESHLCVEQMVRRLLQASKNYLVRDALGSRRPEDKETAIRRKERYGAEIVTTEMMVFERLPMPIPLERHSINVHSANNPA
jgi:nicotinamidase-related amidase